MKRNDRSGASTILTEREHKLDVDKGFVLPDLHPALPRGGRLSRRAPVVLEALYYDTEDLRLLHAGITLRRRSGGTDAGWHLKLPDEGPLVRTEIQLPLGDDEKIPKKLRQVVADRVAHRALEAVVKMRTERTVVDLFDGAGDSLAEVADDQVVAVRLRDGQVSSWREIEIEEAPTARASAERVDALLRAGGARRARHSSKLAYGLAAPPAKAAVSRARTDPLTVRLRTQAAEFIGREADVRASRSDAVHDMRVASRRLRSCLQTFSPAFATRPMTHLRDELRWIGGLLGAERDAEVIAARVTDHLGEIPPQDVIGPVRATLTARGTQATAAAHYELLSALDSKRYRLLLEELAKFVARPPLRKKRSARFLRRRMEKRIRQTKVRIKRATVLDGAAHASALHEVRKMAKQVRYAAETLEPVLGKPASRLAEAFEDVQEVLGEYHDAIVTQQIFRDEATRAGGRGAENGFTYGVLSERERTRATAAEAAFADTWTTVRHVVKKTD